MPLRDVTRRSFVVRISGFSENASVIPTLLFWPETSSFSILFSGHLLLILKNNFFKIYSTLCAVLLFMINMVHILCFPIGLFI